MLSFIGSIGPWEVVVIIVIALLVFGAKKLPELGKAVGKGIREFKKGINDVESDINKIESNGKDPYLELNQKQNNEQKTEKSNGN